ncbi:hypothetical protein [Sulfurisphaera ohwakuensis]|uniref:hypothetical protein n=1 Tax=Sulfurisphaera ohwakuensis TaxID=69656 RepID=UPI0036F42E33
MVNSNVRRVIIEILLILMFLTILPNLSSIIVAYVNTNTNVGYVKYTLILYNNTLLQGNVISPKSDLGPFGILYDPSNGYIYVADSGSDTVSIINSTTNHVIANITIKGHPWSLLYDPSNGYIYVRSLVSLFVIDPSTNQVIANITNALLSPLPVPVNMVYDPSNGYIYITSSSILFPIFVINSSTNEVIHGIKLGRIPHDIVIPSGILYDPSNGYIYVANPRSNSVFVINTSTNKVIANISVGQDPSSMVYDPSNGYIYVTDAKSNMVSVINPSRNQVIANITVGDCPSGIIYDPSNGYIYVTNSLSGSISIITTEPATSTQMTQTSMSNSTEISANLPITYIIIGAIVIVVVVGLAAVLIRKR